MGVHIPIRGPRYIGGVPYKPVRGFDAIGGAEPPPPPGWWDPGDEGLCAWGAWQPVGAADYATSLTDLSGNGNDIPDTGGGQSPAWDAVNGWKFDGVNDYLDTQFIPAAGDQSFLIRLSNAFGSGTGSVFQRPAMLVQAGTWFGVRRNNATFRWSNGGAELNSASAWVASGVLAVAGNRAYVDGVDEGIALPISGGVPFPAPLGCYNNNGALVWFTAQYHQAVAIYDCTLTEAQVQAVTTAMQALV